MGVTNRILVDHRHRDEIDRGLVALFAPDDERWSVTIRPSRLDARWTIEILSRGHFFATTAGPGQQDPASIVTLVRDAMGDTLPAGHQRQE